MIPASQPQLSKPRLNKRERTRHSIIQAAITTIADKGLDNSSIDDLMATAGMARGTFYNYFQTREDVLRAVLDEIHCLIHDQVISKIPTEFSPEAVVACGLYGYLAFCQAKPELGWTMIRIRGFNPWMTLDDERHHCFARIDDALKTLGIDRFSFTTGRNYLQGLSNNISYHVLCGHFSQQNAEELLAFALRGLGISENHIKHLLNQAREFVQGLSHTQGL